MKMVIRSSFLALFFVLYPGTSQGATLPDRPNFVVFIADDVNFDDFGCTGNPDVQTPNIDALAADGLLLENFYLTASSCSVSRNSIMAGRYPHNTGAAELHTQPPEWLPALPGLLRDAGYFTGHSGKFHMGPNVTNGFDILHTRLEDTGSSGMEGWTRILAERPENQPFFLWLAAYDAHRGWGPNAFSGTHDPETLTVPPYFVDAPDTRQDLAHYYDEIFRFDRGVGEVVSQLKEAGVLDHTLIVVMADNGRAFPHSKTRVNDRGMKSPFIVHWPAGIEVGARSQALVSAIDIAPTFLDLAGQTMPESFQGRSFARLLDDPGQGFRDWVFAEHNWHDYEAHERMVRTHDWMYIRNARPNQPQLGPTDSVGSDTHADLVRRRAAGRLSAIQANIFTTPRPFEELYYLPTDPDQWVNVAGLGRHRDALESMRAMLDRWIDETGDTLPANLTRDYFLPVGGYIPTQWHGTRGEMPGTASDAVRINAPGPF